MSSVVRPYTSDDLGQVLRLWESAGDAWPGTDAAMRLLLDSSALGFVAEDGGQVIGCGLGAVAGGVGWIYRIDTANGDAAHELLDALSTALAAAGARVIATVSGDGDALAERGFPPTGAAVFDPAIAHLGRPLALHAPGARVIPPRLWAARRGPAHAQGVTEPP